MLADHDGESALLYTHLTAARTAPGAATTSPERDRELAHGAQQARAVLDARTNSKRSGE